MSYIDAEGFSPLGPEPLVVIELDQPGAADLARDLAKRTLAIVVGVDRAGICPPVEDGCFDLLFTTAEGVASPWVGIAARTLDARVAELKTAVARAPVASSVFAKTLRITAGLAFADALHVESTAYSMLLGGGEFAHWLGARAPRHRSSSDGDCITVARSADRLELSLSRPDVRNTMTAQMRDALFEALAAALDDPSVPKLVLRGEGACFSIGGDIAEFGSNRDLTQAHAIRSLRSCAVLLHDLGERAEVHLHGACIGSGIEIPAAAARVVVIGRAAFQLPELAMGLMPGAGGTVTITARIGRHRTCYLGLSGRRLSSRDALAWGLIDEIRGRS